MFIVTNMSLKGWIYHIVFYKVNDRVLKYNVTIINKSINQI